MNQTLSKHKAYLCITLLNNHSVSLFMITAFLGSKVEHLTFSICLCCIYCPDYYVVSGSIQTPNCVINWSRWELVQRCLPNIFGNVFVCLFRSKFGSTLVARRHSAAFRTHNLSSRDKQCTSVKIEPHTGVYSNDGKYHNYTSACFIGLLSLVSVEKTEKKTFLCLMSTAMIGGK